MYLVDTDVISAGSPSKGRVSEALITWMDRNSERLFISAITVAEIEAGIAKDRREGAGRKASRLTAWLDTLLHLYGSRVLPIDVPAARIAGVLSDRVGRQGHATGFPDLAIAATAAAHRLTLLTGNTKHFVHLGVPMHNPFESLP